MSKSKNTGVATRKVSRATTKPQYLGDVDPAVFVHHNRTHRTASEAFRDADYATPIWRCETDWDRFKEYLTWIVLWAFFLGSMYLMATCFERVMS